MIFNHNVFPVIFFKQMVFFVWYFRKWFYFCHGKVIVL